MKRGLKGLLWVSGVLVVLVVLMVGTSALLISSGTQKIVVCGKGAKNGEFRYHLRIWGTGRRGDGCYVWLHYGPGAD